jgi:23S rRNA (cytosine1962-C5)-methyltransferase
MRRGHPWLFDGHIDSVRHAGRPGDRAVLYDRRNKVIGLGLYDPNSPIRVRCFGRSPLTLDADEIIRRVGAACARRAAIQTNQTNGVRLCHGPNDALPGLVVDRYADTLVIKLYSAIWVPWLGVAVDALRAAAPHDRLVVRTARAVDDDFGAVGLTDGTVVTGPPIDGPVLFVENGVVFEAEPVVGQKTGFFLDQRDNRARVEAQSAEARVLNVFSYTGGFSVYAARGGATDVVSVDISRPAIEATARNLAHNQHHPMVRRARHEGIARDAFKAIAALRDAGRRFDVVIIDPPSFAKRASEVDGALRAYARLTQLGLGVLADGGLAVLASCSSRVTADQFFANAIDAARRAGRSLHEVERTGHAPDHPTAFDEAAYLKCLFARG